jgi:hypothetical protein
MKRFVYIALVFAGLSVVSCTKEQIRPTVDDVQEVPVWRGAGSTTTSDDTTSPGGGSITDPNNDKDENTRRRN